MLNYSALQLLHRHGPGQYEPMAEHTSEDHDPERDLLRGELRGGRIFRCEACADEVLVMPPTGSSVEDRPRA